MMMVNMIIITGVTICVGDLQWWPNSNKS